MTKYNKVVYYSFYYMKERADGIRIHSLESATPPIVWDNAIELTYNVELMPESKKTLEQAADDMITGVTIGTGQTSEGVYTSKLHCLYGPNPGAYKGEVTGIEKTSEKRGTIKVAFSPEIAQTKEMGFAGLFSVAAGDGLGTAYEMSRIRLTDIELPREIVNDFLGPQFGDEGIRSFLKRENDIPLVALLLKPNTGQPSEHYARLSKEATLAGVDYIKEDELQLNHPACPLVERTGKILAALAEAEQITGQAVMYAPNITARSQSQMIDNAKRVVELGATAIMINVMQVGLDSLRVLREVNLGVPIHVHRTGHDNYSRGDVGIDLNVLTKIFRLAGADIVHTGPVFGNLYNPDGIIGNVRALADDWSELKRGFPILSRSAKNIVQDSIDYLGTDLNILHPANVIFLVDKEVYQKADPQTGSIVKATREFVETVKSARVNRSRTKQEILKKQGYSVSVVPSSKKSRPSRD